MGRRRVLTGSATAAGLGALAAFAAAATPAGALTPVRTAWWNEAPLGVVVTPSSVQPGQLLVAEGTGSPDAVAAVDYDVPAGAVASPADASSLSATMTLRLDPNSSFGTPAVMACPVAAVSASWRAGGNQTGKPPAYDCSNGKGVTGQLAANSSSLSFALTPAQQEQDSPGVFNLALVPGSQTPFQTVIDAPSTNDFTVSAPAASDSGGTATGGNSSSGNASSGTAGSTSPSGPGQTAGGGASSGGAASSTDVAATQLSGGDVGSAPSLAAPSAPTVPGAPGAAGSGGTTAGTGTSTVAASPVRTTAANTSGGLFGGRRQRLLGVWLLVDAGLVLLLFGSDVERPPRLLGSVAARNARSRAEAPGAQPGAQPGAEPDAEGEVRGIGRFARPRSAPPRPL